MNERDPREELERYRAGEMTGEERARFEERVLQSDPLSDELYADVSIEASIAEASRRNSRRIPRIATWLVPVAAAAILLLAIQLQGPSTEDPEVLRGGRATAELLAPIGELSSLPTIFRWRAHSQAYRYRFELLDARAQPVLARVVADTFWSPIEGDPPIPPAGSWHLTPLDDLLMDLGDGGAASYRSVP